MNIQYDSLDKLSVLKSEDNLIFSTTLTDDLLLEVLEKVLQYEKDNDFKFNLNFKALSFEQRQLVYNYALTHYDITNGTLLLNVMNVLKSYNLLDDTFFENEHVLCNSIMEFLDIKNNFANLISLYIYDLSKCYLSIIKSLHKIELNYLDDAKEIDKSFFKLIFNFDFYTMSGILAKSKNINTDELYIVDNAYAIFSALVEKQYNVNQVLKKIC